MNPPMGVERRRAPRVKERLLLALTEGASTFQAHLHNLSATGAYCALDRFLPPMTKLEVQCVLLNGSQPTHIRCTGVVVRVEPVVANVERPSYHVAIFFTELSEQGRAAIEQFVRDRLSVT